jgi:hypothetical protein
MDAEQLERLARSYGVAMDRKTLQHVLDDPVQGLAFAEWAKTHLHPDNLLSQDELQM